MVKSFKSIAFALITTAMFSTSAFANTTTVTKASVGKNKAKPIVVVDGAQTNQRVCLYQDEAYSLGAIVEIRDLVLVCQESNDFELNGALKWVVLESSHTRGQE
ncbi:hypothetical protein JCM19233_2092 [Vibrio astriarenae]|nr:hypothetical protein JCM19233_2092 [Vibrio sp. C7]